MSENKSSVKVLVQNTSLRKDQPIYLCDKNGTLAPRAALTLKKHGYTNVYMLKNGLQDWKENLKTKR